MLLRLLLPQLLREGAGLVGDAAVLGQQTYLAVVNDEKHQAEIKSNPDVRKAYLGL